MLSGGSKEAIKILDDISGRSNARSSTDSAIYSGQKYLYVTIARIVICKYRGISEVYYEYK